MMIVLAPIISVGTKSPTTQTAPPAPGCLLAPQEGIRGLDAVACERHREKCHLRDQRLSLRASIMRGARDHLAAQLPNLQASSETIWPEVLQSHITGA